VGSKGAGVPSGEYHVGKTNEGGVWMLPSPQFLVTGKNYRAEANGTSWGRASGSTDGPIIAGYETCAGEIGQA
jgi:hypothetical protein